MQILTKEQFRQWLASKYAEAVVGVPCAAENCPLTRAVRQLNPGCHLEGFNGDRGWFFDTETVKPDLWQCLFANAVDEIFKDEVVITAEQALTILDQIPE